MLDIELFKESQKKRNLPTDPVDIVVDLDEEWRSTLQKVEKLKHERNEASENINALKKAGKHAEAEIKKVRKIADDIARLDAKANELKGKRDEVLSNIPNILMSEVPAGKSEADNKELRKVGKIPKFKNPKYHQDLAKELIDMERAAKVAGARFYYLRGPLVKLNQALINFALDLLEKKDFTLIQPPYMLRKEILAGAITLHTFEDAIYKINDEDLYLIGTAEHAINGYHYGEVLGADELPLRYAGVSACFRREAGSHGKDTKGIFRVHQFEKIEQFVFCKPEQAEKEYKLILGNLEEIYKQLEIPYRLAMLCSGETGMVAAKTIDLEGWFPAQNAYRELASCSNCTDFQARRSKIKYREGGEMKNVYTLNNTALAIQRTIACMLENFQQPDGSVKIPKALWKYTGFKEIKPLKAKK
jgi:seryl-tRNA synthetase